MNIMKKLFKRSLMPFLCILSMTFLLSCQNDDNESIGKETVQVDFEESPVISFDEIEKMTQNIIEGELSIPEETSAVSKSVNTISREKRIFDFSATVNSGSGEGSEISGELKLNYTLYHASFAIVRGKLTLPDGT